MNGGLLDLDSRVRNWLINAGDNADRPRLLAD